VLAVLPAVIPGLAAAYLSYASLVAIGGIAALVVIYALLGEGSGRRARAP
jgi:hypothetical protein